MAPARLVVPALLFYVAAGAPPPVPPQQPSRAFGIVSRVALPGTASWDHITAAVDARRLYVSHDTHVDVLDLDSDSLVGVLHDTPGVHGVALAPELGRGYTSNGGDSTISVFDLKTNVILHRTRLRVDAPDGITYDPSTRRIFAMHEAKPSLTVVETRSDSVLATIQLGDTPDGAVADGRGHLFVALKPTSQLVSIDARRLTIDHRWSLAPCKRPDAIAFDHDRNRIVLGCNNRLAVAVDVTSGRVLTSFPIGAEVDGISLDDDGGAIVSCGDGTVHIAQRRGDVYHVMQIVSTPRGAPNSALDRRRGRVYVPTGKLQEGAPRTPSTVQHARKTFGLLVIGRISRASRVDGR